MQRCEKLNFATVRLVSRIFFFFQAEDGIRDTSVTGVQTCALPIFIIVAVGVAVMFVAVQLLLPGIAEDRLRDRLAHDGRVESVRVSAFPAVKLLRSEERRVGKECRSWWEPDQLKKTEEESKCRHYK